MQDEYVKINIQNIYIYPLDSPHSLARNSGHEKYVEILRKFLIFSKF